MAKGKVVLHNAEFARMRNSPEMKAAVSAEAQKIANRAGPGFLVGVHNMDSRVIANVYTGDAEAMRAEAKHGALSKAVGGGG